MKWMRTCQECGHEQPDSAPDRSKELSTAYCNRKCKKCKSEALDYGREVPEPAEIYADHPRCDECGKLDFAVADGYAFGDRLLEEVYFRFSLSADGAVTATPAPEAEKYLASLNAEEWLGKAEVYACETDTLTCPTCGADVDGFAVIGAPVRPRRVPCPR
jgi:hypothetical protein